MNRRVTESVFLKGNYRVRDQISNRALILGGDEYGIQIADLLKRNGFEATIFVGFRDAHPSSPTLDVIKGKIEKITGFIGDFNVAIRTSTDLHEIRFGFIIAAQPAHRRSKTSSFGAAGLNKVYNLSEFKQFLDSSGRSLLNNDRNWRHIAFFFDLKGSSEVSQFDILLSVLDRLEMLDQVQSYIFTRNVKVASGGLEARYRYHRQHGVVFFKFDETEPRIVQDGKNLIIEFVEPLLREEMELTPDIIVIDEILSPADSLEPILNLIPSAHVSAPYLQPESTRFNGVETQKAGIYAVGPARGAFDQESLKADVEAVMISLFKAMPQLSDFTPKLVAHVDHDKCTFCLTCVRLCPHGAIGFHSRPEVDPLSCKACGVCVVECPMGAIEMRCGDVVPPTTEKPLLYGAGFKGHGRIKLFLCARSGLQAASRINSSLLSDVEICELTCAGSLSPNFLLKCFRDGVAGIIVAGCFKGNCASIYGSTLADERVAQVSRTLEQAGIDPKRLEFVYVAGNTPSLIVEAIFKVKGRVGDLNQFQFPDSHDGTT